MADVVTDADLVAQLTSGLYDVGAESLGLFPEGLRHPFGVRDALRGPADYEGGVVRSAWSRTAHAMFGALGAELSDESLDTDTMLGAESSFRITPAGVATGNVGVDPKINVLTARSDLRDQLTEDQWAAARGGGPPRPVAGCSTPTPRTRRPQRPSSATRPGRSAPPARPRSAIWWQRPAASSTTCARMWPPPPSSTPSSASSRTTGSPSSVTACPERSVDRATDLDGRYTFTVTEEQVRAAGGTDQELIDENTGKFTMTFDDGIFILKQIYAQGPNAGTTWQGTGGFTFDGTRLQLFYSQDSDDCMMAGRGDPGRRRARLQQVSSTATMPRLKPSPSTASTRRCSPGRRLDPELVEDVLDVGLDRLDAEVEALGDPEVGAAPGHQLEDLVLARCEGVDEPGAPRRAQQQG